MNTPRGGSRGGNCQKASRSRDKVLSARFAHGRTHFADLPLGFPNPLGGHVYEQNFMEVLLCETLSQQNSL